MAPRETKRPSVEFLGSEVVGLPARYSPELVERATEDTLLSGFSLNCRVIYHFEPVPRRSAGLLTVNPGLFKT